MSNKKRNSMIVRMALVFALLIGVISVIPTFASTSVIYVKWDANGSSNGTSWANAYTDLQSALAAASSGSEIWVAAGTYKPTTDNDRSVSFLLKNDVAVYGGFAGNELFLTQRYLPANITVLSGDIGFAGDTSDNSYHVVDSSYTNETAVLDGFTITAGNANQNQLDKGGGMLNMDGSPTLTNIIFSDNSANLGGGMYSGTHPGLGFTSNPILTNVVFIGNSAIEGGGMENQFHSSPMLVNVSFTNNSAVRSGGGLLNYDHSNPILRNVTFEGNTASVGAGLMNSGISTPTLTNATFYGNSASDLGGGIYNDDAGVTLTNVTMSGNSARQGGAVYNGYFSYINIVNSILYGNAASDGNEIYNSSGSLTVTYSIVQGGYPGTGNLLEDPQLGSLQEYGGFTKTMAPALGSPAINAGDDANCPATDQRGVTRPQGSHCDMGSYESIEATGTITVTFTTTPVLTATNMPTSTITATPTQTPKHPKPTKTPRR